MALCTGDQVLAQLHPEAAARGWRIADVQLGNGPYGEYQTIQLTRVDQADINHV
ncbi:hypothetical protein [Pseudarthrobacter sp. SSS035]|uniref:hypothetical protein n=1 Tax=Pseudarthrobacter sp. SSS035 TaxID=2931399 RepID=UPI00200DF210|nr:hypothetical protein [Pseudarthrobacter sp. SSS035]